MRMLMVLPAPWARMMENRLVVVVSRPMLQRLRRPSRTFYFSDKNKTATVQKQYLDLDESIKVQVDPVERSPVVDRVIERSTIYVKAPGSVRVEIYLEPVDSPFCGKSLGEPRLLGKSSDGRRNFPVVWSNVEEHRYVKVYAKVYKRGLSTFGRSRSVDLAMCGQRFQPAPAAPPAPPVQTPTR